MYLIARPTAQIKSIGAGLHLVRLFKKVKLDVTDLSEPFTNDSFHFLPNIISLKLELIYQSLTNPLTDGLSSLINLTHLNINGGNSRFWIDSLTSLKNLRSLRLEYCRTKIDHILNHLHSLTALDISKSGQYGISLTSVQNLISLKVSDIDDLYCNSRLSHLTKLETLNIAFFLQPILPMNIIICQFTTLTSLTLTLSRWDPDHITDHALRTLLNLTELNLFGTATITDDSIILLKKLKSLRLVSCNSITDKSIGELTSLVSLSMTHTENIRGWCFSSLVNLRELEISNKRLFSPMDTKYLTAVESLKLGSFQPIDGAEISAMTNLTTMTFYEDPAPEMIVTFRQLKKLKKVTLHTVYKKTIWKEYFRIQGINLMLFAQ